MSGEDKQWDALYESARARGPRSRAEADSVPIPEEWGVLPAAEEAALGFLLPWLARAQHVLDLGCGTGSVLAAVLARFPESAGVGLDASRVALALGRVEVGRRRGLAERMALVAADLRRPPLRLDGRFDVVYAFYSLQFITPREMDPLLAAIEGLLRPGGVFAGTVRSTSRSVPASYVPTGEANTWTSREPHEGGMVYHHYGADELVAAAARLGGDLAHLEERVSYRDYDPAPARAWWDFVIVT